MFRGARLFSSSVGRASLAGSVCAVSVFVALPAPVHADSAASLESLSSPGVHVRVAVPPSAVARPEPAGIWIRFFARALDVSFIGGLVGIIQLFSGPGVLVMAVGAVLDLLKDIIFGKGRSVGKYLLNLQPVDASGAEATSVQRVARNSFAPFVVGLVSTAGIGVSRATHLFSVASWASSDAFLGCRLWACSRNYQ